MSLSWLITNLIAAILLPPLNLLVPGLWGLFLLRHRRRLAIGLISFSLVALWLLSTPYVAKAFLAAFETPPLAQPTGKEADAIVILGGGTYPAAPEYGNDTVRFSTLQRLRYGAHLARLTGKPILVSGGAPDGGPAEAPLMREVLVNEFAVPVRWVEAGSDNTYDNAMASAALLHAAGITRIYLVSDAWHLTRAVPMFERTGLTVVPAGTGYVNTAPTLPLDFLPDGAYLRYSHYATHEAIGWLWYRLRQFWDQRF